MNKVIEIPVESLEGKVLNLLNEYPGKPLLLLFYNNRCLGCTGRAIPLAYDYMQEMTELQVIGIHSNFNNEVVTKEDILNIFTSKSQPFPIYIDKEHEVYDKFECEGTPQWILINKQGNVFRSIFGSQDGAQNRLSYALDELLTEI